MALGYGLVISKTNGTYCLAIHYGNRIKYLYW